MTDINELLSRLNPKIAERFRIASEISPQFQRLPSLGLNRALQGGMRYGSTAVVWGNRSAGKTASLIQMIGNAQKDSRGVAWIDAEKQFDPAWARRLGADPDQILVSPINSVADMADAGVDMLRANVDILVIDSISSLLSNAYFDDGEIKDFAKTGQIGTLSKNLGSAATMLNAMNKDTLIIYISQVRNQFGSMHASLVPMGGKAMEHIPSTIIKLWSSFAQDDQIYGDISDGDLIFKEPIGRKVTWTIGKSRGKGEGMTGSYDFYFNGDHVGVDNVAETLDLAVMYGKVKKGGAWYTIYDERLQGGKKATAYLRSNPEILEKLEQELNA